MKTEEDLILELVEIGQKLSEVKGENKALKETNDKLLKIIQDNCSHEIHKISEDMKGWECSECGKRQ